MKLIFAKSVEGRRGLRLPASDVPAAELPQELLREQSAELPEVSELDALRHFTLLGRQNMGVDTNFYPLGSCTMKYNPKINERLAALPGFTELHPMLAQLPEGEQYCQGALALLYECEKLLAQACGFADSTLQPMAGANGELTAIMMFAAYLKSKGETRRKVMLIPDSAHGTNPASAAVAGFTCREIASNEEGDLDIEELKKALNDEVAGIMLTTPNTLGFYNSSVAEVVALVHQAGGLAYCDGANLNAILGRIRPGDLGFDAMHINTHKTLSTPHGGGGPGSGPVCVAARLLPFLPQPKVHKNAEGLYSLSEDAPQSIGYIAPYYGNFSIIVRAYAYMLMCGGNGFQRISENAVLSANYVRERLAPWYEQKYERSCMHECVLSASRQSALGVNALDIAKALLDRGFHAPTIYFPLIVPEALMIEPTETESKQTLDEFCEAMIAIAKLAEENPEELKKAPLSTPVGRLDEVTAARQPLLRV
ncbi:MAG: aminomethyl-transferring glycine dehydrogenase subunit GcvPB [Lentisphaeria bacterium]|jgi:glycine dehydrogenase subunit 2|nr:aminomethyl-transferring glycine dehydrogenase subunit GcvPB [Lentisphaeria bacterium]MDY0176701.1 aminomethyl-transferring glycine dehydrogenase subunit GcvPB [Lentisphaeria bacterium]NLZ60700.1 aminomethyl-transferring glycine dehydrogenase subunit GcvPB [Lentisphaerota bacterium]